MPDKRQRRLLTSVVDRKKISHVKSFVATLAALALVLPAAASAHRSDWFWSRGKAENRLLYSSTGRQLGIVARPTCYPKGGSLLSSDGSGVRLYQHFDCYLNTRRGRYYGVFHVLTKDKFLFTLEE